MLEQLLAELHQKARGNVAKNTLALPFETILEKIKSHPYLPLENIFTKGQLVTQVIAGVDLSGEPETRYKFPLPGQPAIVVDVIPNAPVTEGKPSIFWGKDDISIGVLTPIGVKHFIASSRYFRPWNPETDTKVDDLVEADINKKTKADEED